MLKDLTISEIKGGNRPRKEMGDLMALAESIRSQFIGIEKDRKYINTARNRIAEG